MSPRQTAAIACRRTPRRALPALLLSVLALVMGLTPASAGAPATAAAAVAAASTVGAPGCGQARTQHASCFVRMHVKRDSSGRVRPAASSSSPTAGYSPSQLQSAYALPVSGGGGQVIAVVDAYDTAAAEADLAAYRSQFGLPACTSADGCFRKIDLGGASALPYGWDIETSLDLDMASAACPNCGLVLVEARSDGFSDIYSAIQAAIDSGASEVSMSFGIPESPDELNHDYLFNRTGVAFTAATGDCGYGVSYPAASPYVAAVGGTTLVPSGNARGWTETAWVGSAADPTDCGSGNTASGAGSGCSQFEPKPSWQVDTGCSRRTVADVSANSDFSTGVAVYDSADTSSGGWTVVGGTSAAAPFVAGAWALSGGLSYYPPGAEAFYQSTGGNVDVTQDTSSAVSCGPTYLCNAVAGYDGPTGVGSPVGGLIDVGVGVSQKYVQHLYTDLVGGVDPGGEAYWVSQLLRGAPRSGVAHAFTQTPQYRSLVIAQLYLNELGRPVGSDPGGAWWADQLRTQTPEQVAASLVASDELFNNPSFGNGNDDTYIAAVYRALLGRDPDSAGAAFWHGFLSTHPRWQMTLGFTSGTEWAGITVDRMYALYHLGSPDSGGRAYWAGRLVAGMHDDQVVANLLSSNQYYSWAQSN